jgi:Tfp pilus assembly protein PilF
MSHSEQLADRSFTAALKISPDSLSLLHDYAYFLLEVANRPAMAAEVAERAEAAEAAAASSASNITRTELLIMGQSVRCDAGAGTCAGD